MAEISAQIIKNLRDKTGAGMMNCKKALQETNGDISKAIAWLRQKNIVVTCRYPPPRVTVEGLIYSYIHTAGKVGVLLEVNCETDFVARTPEFQTLVHNVALQIVACPTVEYVKVGDIPTAIVNKEKEIEMGRDDLLNKPDSVKEKIVQGRIDKHLKAMSLLDQPYIRDQNITVEQLVKQAIAQLGENIQVRRFVRFVLSESNNK